MKRLLNGSLVLGCILEQLPLIRHLQIQLVKHHGQSLLTLQVDPIQKCFLWFRNLVGAVPRSFFLEAPIQMFPNVAIDNANAWRAKFSRKARCDARQAGRTLRRNSPFCQRRLQRNIGIHSQDANNLPWGKIMGQIINVDLV